MPETSKFVQIAAQDGRLYALDKNGRVWMWYDSTPHQSAVDGWWRLLSDERHEQ